MNPIPFIDFKRKYSLYKKKIDATIKKVFEYGWFILGPELEKFEKNFAKYLGIKYVVGVGSATDALFLSLKALKVTKGDEVITVANTATPTVIAIRMTGAMPVFIDVDENDFNINFALIEKKITKKTKAILPVHLYGYPAKMGEILRIAKKYHLKIVEDASQAPGAEYKKIKVGTIGDVGCFSFYPTKNLGAFGDAGAVATNNKKLAQTVRMLRNYGESSKFNNVIEGYNSRLDEIQAAILNWELTKLNSWNMRREKLANLYLKNLRGLPIVLPRTKDKIFHPVWHLFIIKDQHRDKLKKFLAKRNIQTMIHYPKPIFEQPAYRFLNYKTVDLPITAKLSKEILSLPLYPEMKEKEVLETCKAIRLFYNYYD